MPSLNRKRVTTNTPTPFGSNPILLNILIQMKNNNLSEDTIKNTSKLLSRLSHLTDLNNPEQVKQSIAQMQASQSYKRNLCIAYNKYVKYCKLQWEMPHYRQEAKKRRIPTKEKLEMIISSCGRILATRLRLSMETGIRPVELCNLKVRDIDLEQRIIYPTTAKHGTPRALKISEKLQTMLQTHITKSKLQPNDRLFNGNSNYYGLKFRTARNRLADKLGDPTIQQIKLYDFRHYFATMLYHKVRDIFYVKEQMGHSQIKTTMVYVQLLYATEDEYTCKVAQNINEATQLIENGFEYVTEIDGTKLFRKRK